MVTAVKINLGRQACLDYTLFILSLGLCIMKLARDRITSIFYSLNTLCIVNTVELPDITIYTERQSTMPWCPKCAREYMPGVDLCSDCGCPLTDRKPEKAKSTDMKSLFKESIWPTVICLVACLASPWVLDFCMSVGSFGSGLLGEFIVFLLLGVAYSVYTQYSPKPAALITGFFVTLCIFAGFFVVCLIGPGNPLFFAYLAIFGTISMSAALTGIYLGSILSNRYVRIKRTFTIVLLALCLLGTYWVAYYVKPEHHLDSYRHLEKAHATRDQVIEQFGSDYRSEGDGPNKTIIYYTDPLADGEGWNVYIEFDQSDRVTNVRTERIHDAD